MLLAALAGDIVADVHDIRRAAVAQQIGTAQVDQVGREHVDLKQLAEGVGFLPGRIGAPLRGVVHDRPQAAGQLPDGSDEGMNAGFIAEVRLHHLRAGSRATLSRSQR